MLSGHPWSQSGEGNSVAGGQGQEGDFSSIYFSILHPVNVLDNKICKKIGSPALDSWENTEYVVAS